MPLIGALLCFGVLWAWDRIDWYWTTREKGKAVAIILVIVGIIAFMAFLSKIIYPY